MKNYSEAVKDKSKRQLTAKGNTFVWRCIDIVANAKGTNKFSPDFKADKEKIRVLIHDLLIDKELSIKDVTELIKEYKFKTIN